MTAIKIMNGRPESDGTLQVALELPTLAGTAAIIRQQGVSLHDLETVRRILALMPN